MKRDRDTSCILMVWLLLGSCLSAFESTDSAGSAAFFAKGVIPRFQIQLDAPALASLRQDSRRYVKATVTDGDVVYRDVGLRLKGGLASFRPLDDKPCLTLNFDKFVRGQKFHGLDKLHLNNSVQDPTFLTELVCGELFREAGIPAPQVSHAVVRLNGRALGLYVLIQGFGKQFLRQHFASPHGNLYDGGERTDIMDPLRKGTGDGPDDRSDLRALAEAARTPLSNRLERLSRVLELDRFYSFLAMETLMCHWDGYAMGQNNYRVYHDPRADRFIFLPHGMDQMFGRPQGSLLPDCRGFVAWSVLSTPAGRRCHRERCAKLFAKLFSLPRLTNRINTLQQRLRPVLLELGSKFAESHDQAVATLRTQVVQRIGFLDAEINTPALQPLTFDSNGIACLTGWTANLNGGEVKFDEVNEPDPCLRISSVGEHIPFVASWRAKILLPAGDYHFRGNIRTARLTPVQKSPGGAVSLRIYGHSFSPPAQFAGDTGSKTLQADFSLAEPEETELICEVRAFKGTVWFDKNSLQIEKTGEDGH